MRSRANRKKPAKFSDWNRKNVERWLNNGDGKLINNKSKLSDMSFGVFVFLIDSFIHKGHSFTCSNVFVFPCFN